MVTTLSAFVLQLGTATLKADIYTWKQHAAGIEECFSSIQTQLSFQFISVCLRWIFMQLLIIINTHTHTNKTKQKTQNDGVADQIKADYTNTQERSPVTITRGASEKMNPVMTTVTGLHM